MHILDNQYNTYVLKNDQILEKFMKKTKNRNQKTLSSAFSVLTGFLIFETKIKSLPVKLETKTETETKTKNRGVDRASSET